MKEFRSDYPDIPPSMVDDLLSAIQHMTRGKGDSFDTISAWLRQRLLTAEDALIEARRDQQEMARAQIEAREREQAALAERAGEEIERKRQEIRAEIDRLSASVSQPIGDLTLWIRSGLVFARWTPQTWIDPQLPLRRYEIEKERYLAAINTAHEVFTKDVLASSVIPEEPDPDLVQATNDYNASMVEVSVRLDEALLDADKAARKFQEHADWGLGWLAVPAIVLDGVLVVLFVAYLLVLAFHLIPLWVFRDLLGLVERSEDEIQSLQFEITESQESTLNLSPLQRIGANLSRSQQRRSRDLTLPGLTARYVDYIRDVQRVFGKWSGSKKLIVCIDELDKITDPEQVGQVLREIKGGLYLENCFYLISISEDAVRAFEGRLVEQRDIFESTFDEILFLERLDLETCVAIGWARCGKKVQESLTPDELSAAQESMEIAAVLSTGVPRELLRNLRAVGNACDGVRTFNPSAAWHALFERKIWDVQKKVRTSDGLEEIRANLMDELGHYLIGGDERYDTARVASAFAEIRATQERLLKRAAETEHQADNATEEFRIHALRRQVDLLRSWVRHWMELEIHLLVWHYSLSSANSSDPTQRTSDYGKLLDIYASLPYSMAVTARRLAELDVIGPPTPLGPTRVSQAAQAASS